MLEAFSLSVIKFRQSNVYYLCQHLHGSLAVAKETLKEASPVPLPKHCAEEFVIFVTS